MAFFIILTVFTALLLIAVSPLVVKASVYFDLDKRTAIIGVRLFFIRVLTVRVFELRGKIYYSLNGDYAEELQFNGKKAENRLKYLRFSVQSI